jgi:hypothetical protein
MAFFKTSLNIFKKPWEDELFDENKWDMSTIAGQLPWSGGEWDYKRPLTVDDIDIWEVLYESGGHFGIYAAWSPHAEFYMIRLGYIIEESGYGIETYYGAESGKMVYKRAKELGIDLPVFQDWVDPDKAWLYNPVTPEHKKIISTAQPLSVSYKTSNPQSLPKTLGPTVQELKQKEAQLLQPKIILP